MPTVAESFRAFNPATRQYIDPEFPISADADVARASEDAWALFESGSPKRSMRAGLLRRIGERIGRLGDDLIRRAMAETALPEGRLVGERARTVDQLNRFADLVESELWMDVRRDAPIPDRAPIPKPDLRSMLVPVGPVAVFGASNFPLAFSTAGGDTASALAAGCPVVVKAHPAHPGTSEMVAHAIGVALKELGLPRELFAHLQGLQETGAALVRQPGIKAVAFTGSFAGGMALWRIANERPEPIPVFAEMGSINPIFFLPEALEERAEDLGRAYAASLTLGFGQFCTNPGLVVAIESQALRRWVESVKNGLAQTSPGPMLAESIAAAYRQAVQERSDRASVLFDPCGELRPALFEVSAGQFLAGPESPAESGGTACWQDEIFGPAGLVVSCRGQAEMLEVAKSLRGQLTATMHIGEHGEHAFESHLVSVLRLKVGRIIVNGFPTGVEVCPAMHHGGPFPATTDSRFTSVGTRAIQRFLRPICYQNVPDALLPAELRGL